MIGTGGRTASRESIEVQSLGGGWNSLLAMRKDANRKKCAHVVPWFQGEGKIVKKKKKKKGEKKTLNAKLTKHPQEIFQKTSQGEGDGEKRGRTPRTRSTTTSWEKTIQEKKE